MKSVLISIQPKWVEKICKGEKTIEVRKTRPKIETPFKCYIYCTKEYGYSNGEKLEMSHYLENGIWFDTGKVIGEFVCDRIDKYEWLFPFESEDFQHALPQGHLEKTCLEDYELDEYLDDKAGYGWHITDLKIYDKPKVLSEFKKPCDRFLDCITCKRLVRNEFLSCDNKITRPPQSWCYVEENEDER